MPSKSAWECSDCGERAEVINSRISADDAVMRRRQCPKCKKRWTTYEVHESDWSVVLKVRDVRRRLEAGLKVLLQSLDDDTFD